MMTKLYCKMVGKLTRLKNEKGQTLVEYGLILTLVTITLFAVLFAMKDSLMAIFGKVTTTLAVASGS